VKPHQGSRSLYSLSYPVPLDTLQLARKLERARGSSVSLQEQMPPGLAARRIVFPHPGRAGRVRA
jgi:hypothetical protein